MCANTAYGFVSPLRVFAAMEPMTPQKWDLLNQVHVPRFRQLRASKTRYRKNTVYKYESTSNERDWMIQVSCWASLCNKKVLTQMRIWVQPWICYFLKLNVLNIFKCIYFLYLFFFFRKCERPHMVTNNDRFQCFGVLVRGTVDNTLDTNRFRLPTPSLASQNFKSGQWSNTSEIHLRHVCLLCLQCTAVVLKAFGPKVPHECFVCLFVCLTHGTLSYFTFSFFNIPSYYYYYSNFRI